MGQMKPDPSLDPGRYSWPGEDASKLWDPRGSGVRGNFVEISRAFSRGRERRRGKKIKEMKIRIVSG